MRTAGNQFIRNTCRTILIVGNRLGNAQQLCRLPAAQPNHVHHFFDRQAVQHIFPCRIVVCLAAHGNQLDTFARTCRRHNGVRVVSVMIFLTVLQQLVARLHGMFALFIRLAVEARPCAIPITARQIDILAVIVRHAAVIKLIADSRSRCAVHCAGRCVQFLLHIGCCHGSIARIIHAVFNRAAFCRQDVVDCIVCIVRHGKVVRSRINNVGARIDSVIRTQLFFWHSQRNRLCFARQKQARFAETAQLHRCLLYQILLIIVRIGRLEVDLNNFLARHSTCIGDIHRNSKLIFLFRQLEIAVFKGCVAQSVAKGIQHFLAIVPRLVVRSALSAVCISLPQYRILIARFIIAITDVNSFAINHIGILRAHAVIAVFHAPIAEIFKRS